MDLKKARLSKILHCVVDEFISSIEDSFLPEGIDIQKIFYEIVKRKESITHDLQTLALSVNNKFHSESEEHDVVEFLDWEQSVKARIKNLVQDLFSQDLLEIALNEFESFCISEEDLHNLLYFETLKDVTSFSPSPLELGRQFNFSTPFFTSIPFMEKTSGPSFVSFSQLYPQFENATMQFDADLLQMRRVLEEGFAVSDLDDCSIAVMSVEKAADRQNVLQKTNYLNCCEDPVESFHKCNLQSSVGVSPFEFEVEELNDVSEDSGFLCWEDCLGRGFLREHAYISESASEAVHRNISEKEYSAYSSLVNMSDAISEDEMVLDILDVLTGTPSNTFFYDIHGRRFRMKSNVHIPNLSTECTARLMDRYLESGSMYYALQNFSHDFLHASEGSVFKGMQCGVWQVLCIYKEYIEAVKAKSPTMLFLKTDVMKNAELLFNFGIICGIDPEKMIINEIPKGLGLLSYLHDVARSHIRKENGILIAVLLKYAYEPYFRFLNEWITEGCCNDSCNEFQIIEDSNFLKRRDSLFWKFAYTENIDDPTRAVPPELKDFSLGILDCGKSIKLLKYLSSELYHSRIFSYKPPPPLSLVCSFPAVIHKVEECVNYILLKEHIDTLSNVKAFNLSDDEFHLEAQKLVSEKQMIELVNRRYNIIAASCASKSNIINFKKLSSYHNKHNAEKNAPVKSFEPQKKSDCMSKLALTNKETVHRQLLRSVESLFSTTEKSIYSNNFIDRSSPDDCNNIFSGKLYSDIGLLFSSCGYMETDMISDNACDGGEWSFLSPNLNKQLCLSSYNSLSSSRINYLRNKFTSFRTENSNSEILSTFENANFSNVSTEDEHFIREVLLKSAPSVETGKGISACDNENRNSFMDKLTSILVSEYGDSIDDIKSYNQVTSLQRLMAHNFYSVVKTRIHVVEKAIMKCIVKEYQLDTLLSNLQNIFFLQDENFSQSLCKPLFDRVMKCRTPGEFAKYSILNGMLASAISDSDYAYDSFIFSLNVNIGSLPLNTSIERIDFLKLFIIECKVNWPLNIIVHNICIQQYSKIFSVLLEIEFLCWLLGKTWRYLTVCAKEFGIQDEPEFREMMLSRFEMDQFIRVLRNSIHQHLQGPLWDVLKKSLSAEKSSIDDLETVHNEYLEKILARCFLTDETCKLHDILTSMFHQVYRICNAVLACTWKKNEKSGHFETSYKHSSSAEAFKLFTRHQRVFLEYIMKESLTKKCGRYWDKDYQTFLETISETKSYR